MDRLALIAALLCAAVAENITALLITLAAFAAIDAYSVYAERRRTRDDKKRKGAPDMKKIKLKARRKYDND